ncbi:Phosphatidylethanolamine-binding protein 1 [Balamuthia mandrillaris]
MTTNDVAERTLSRDELKAMGEILLPFEPSVPLNISWEGAALLDQRKAKVDPSRVRERPSVKFTPEPGAYYTLALVGPDGPNHNTSSGSSCFCHRVWRHWLVVNIRGNEVQKGDEVTDYSGPSPPKGAGLRRYTFVLFKQPSSIVWTPLMNDARGRSGFSINDWVIRHRLQPVGCQLFFADAS